MRLPINLEPLIASRAAHRAEAVATNAIRNSDPFCAVRRAAPSKFNRPRHINLCRENDFAHWIHRSPAKMFPERESWRLNTQSDRYSSLWTSSAEMVLIIFAQGKPYRPLLLWEFSIESHQLFSIFALYRAVKLKRFHFAIFFQCEYFSSSALFIVGNSGHCDARIRLEKLLCTEADIKI